MPEPAGLPDLEALVEATARHDYEAFRAATLASPDLVSLEPWERVNERTRRIRRDQVRGTAEFVAGAARRAALVQVLGVMPWPSDYPPSPLGDALREALNTVAGWRAAATAPADPPTEGART